MSMEKTYDPGQHEAPIYKMWEDSGAFKPNLNSKKEPFSIIMPPPNANGHIHLGTAMFTLEDIMIRYRRMRGHPTLWLPGTDHAGIETQVVFERELEKEGKSRFDFTPKEFYEAALAYTESNRHVILSELRQMGFSADWSRLKFTLDEDIIRIVYKTFKELHDDGYVYRGNRIVNWCPTCNSTFADIEVKHREQIDPLYYIKYGPFVLATVRPETKFGDTAIAVHPDDERYQKYIDKEIEADGLLGPFKLKVIADNYVDPAFGTGVVKVTPAHDPNDWEMGLRHKLEVKQAVGTDGRLTSIAGKYAGMKVTEAREAVVQDLEAKGLIDHIEMNYSHSVGYHGRCGTQIEPLVTEQWWLKVDQLKQPAKKAVTDNRIRIIPPRFNRAYTDWMENLKDWNISRQNWFGIPIPVYYNASGDNSKDPYILAIDEDGVSRETIAKDYYGEGNYEADTDTFDTWFSSSQWPYATLMSTGDFDRFYPSTVMETGRDILFLWVSRMVMLGLYKTDNIPFKNIYLHGMVNDAKGRKMSKSKGNVVNPLEWTARYGTDALRLALTIGITPGNDGALSEKKVEGYRNFANKLWNASRYVIDKGGDYSPSPPEPVSLADKWIMTKVSRETEAITKAIEEYRFSEAGERVYSLLWNDFADWYLEASKIESNMPVLISALETILKLAHPFAPFVTEAVWQNMPWQSQKLITTRWPDTAKVYSSEYVEFEQIMALVSQIRSIQTDLQLGGSKLFSSDKQVLDNHALISSLAKVGEVVSRKGSGGLRVPSTALEAWLDLDKPQLAKYSANLESRRKETEAYLKKLEKQLSNRGYTDNAPADLIAQTQDRKREAELLISQLDEQLRGIKQL